MPITGDFDVFVQRYKGINELKDAFEETPKTEPFAIRPDTELQAGDTINNL